MVEPIVIGNDLEVRQLLEPLFVREDANSANPFNVDAPVKRLLFDWEQQGSIKGNLLSALVQAAKSVGDEGFYLKGHLPEENNVVAWYIPFSEIDEYENAGEGNHRLLSAATDFEETLLSPNGKWAILTSHEDHRLLACSKEFIEVFEPLVPDIENQVFRFLKNWRRIKETYGTSVGNWLPGLVKQIYGKDRGNELLLEYNLLHD